MPADPKEIKDLLDEDLDAQYLKMGLWIAGADQIGFSAVGKSPGELIRLAKLWLIENRDLLAMLICPDPAVIAVRKKPSVQGHMQAIAAIMDALSGQTFPSATVASIVFKEGLDLLCVGPHDHG